MDNNHKKQRIYTLAIIAIGVLSVVLLVVLFWLGSDFFRLNKIGAIQPSIFRAGRRPAPTPDQVQGWMTFHYINYIFRLPADYLPARLNLVDPAYPNITLDQYASGHQLNAAALLQSVKDAVNSYEGGRP